MGHTSAPWETLTYLLLPLTNTSSAHPSQGSRFSFVATGCFHPLRWALGTSLCVEHISTSVNGPMEDLTTVRLEWKERASSVMPPLLGQQQLPPKKPFPNPLSAHTFTPFGNLVWLKGSTLVCSHSFGKLCPWQNLLHKHAGTWIYCFGPSLDTSARSGPCQHPEMCMWNVCSLPPSPTQELTPMDFSTLSTPFPSSLPVTPQNGLIPPICISMVAFAYLYHNQSIPLGIKTIYGLSPTPRAWKFLGSGTLEIYCYIFKDYDKI